MLKAALANVVRRLEVLETERNRQNGNVFPNGGMHCTCRFLGNQEIDPNSCHNANIQVLLLREQFVCEEFSCGYCLIHRKLANNGI